MIFFKLLFVFVCRDRLIKHVNFQIDEQPKGMIDLDETESQPIKEVLAIGTSKRNRS